MTTGPAAHLVGQQGQLLPHVLPVRQRLRRQALHARQLLLGGVQLHGHLQAHAEPPRCATRTDAYRALHACAYTRRHIGTHSRIYTQRGTDLHCGPWRRGGPAAAVSRCQRARAEDAALVQGLVQAEDAEVPGQRMRLWCRVWCRQRMQRCPGRGCGSGAGAVVQHTAFLQAAASLQLSANPCQFRMHLSSECLW